MDIIFTISVKRRVDGHERQEFGNLRWKIVINNEGDLLHVNTASPDVGRNQHSPALPEPK